MSTTTPTTTVTTDTSNSSNQFTLTAIQSSIFAFAFAGNVVTLLCLHQSQRRQRGKRLTRMSLFIVHLCIADLCVAIFNVAPNLCTIVSFPSPCFLQASEISCKLVNYLSLTPIYGSTYVLVMTALDRFVAIKYPLWAQRLHHKHVHMMSAVAWLVALLFSSPQLVIFRFDGETQRCYTEWNQNTVQHVKLENAYVIWFAIAVWILPTLIISFSYGNILVTVWRSGRDRTNSQQSQNRSKMVKPVQITLAVVTGYLACWTPWMVATLVLQFNAQADARLGLLSYLIGFNSCLNPLIYLCFNYSKLSHSRRSKKVLRANAQSTQSTAATNANVTQYQDFEGLELQLIERTNIPDASFSLQEAASVKTDCNLLQSDDSCTRLHGE